MKWCFFFFLICGGLQAMSKASPTLQVGVRTLEYHDAKRDRPVVVELWHPTEQNGPFEESADGWIHPKEIRNAPILNGKYPLIVISHGHGGNRRYLSWMVEDLVRNGFMVAAVDHHGNSWRSYNPLLSLRFWERARDISFAIGALLKEPGLRIDPKRIGFIGYSLGGMTGLALGGARAENVKEIVQSQQKKYKEIDLALVEQIDFSEGQGDFREPHIRAIALLSPAVFVFTPQSLKQVQVPLALVASEHDEVLPFPEHAAQLIQHAALAKVKLFREKISHYAFFNRVSPAGKEAMKKELCTEGLQADRVTVHQEVGPFLVSFFKETL